MISPDMFPSTEMEISEKWDRSSANYISENWKRNNWDIFVEIVLNDAGFETLILL